MRILHVIDTLDPEMGGLPRAALSLACAQAMSGHAVGILFYEHVSEQSGEGMGIPEVLQEAYGWMPGFEAVEKISMPRPSRISWLLGCGIAARIRAFAPELLHTHGLWEPILRHAHALAGAADVPYVITPHGMMHPWQDPCYARLKWGLMHLLGWRRCWRRAAFAQALTEPEAAHLRHRRCFAQVCVIPNGIFLQEADQEGPLPACFGLGPFVLFLGRLAKGKGPDLLLEAFGKIAGDFPDHRLVLAGPDYGMGAWLQARAASMGLRQRVCFPGQLQGGEKWAALREAACFCMPSRAEGFGLSLLEAGLAGTPILQSEACWFRGLVGEGGAVVFPLTVTDFAAALAEVLENPTPHAAETVIREKYTWPRVAARFDEEFQRVF